MIGQLESKLIYPKETFESFIRGPGREDAVALAVEFCKCRIGAGFPYIIVGNSGEGKTHLLRAIENRLQMSGDVKIFWANSLQLDASDKRFPQAQYYIIDDLTCFLLNEARSRSILREIEIAIAARKMVILGSASSSKGGTIDQLFSLWPNAKIVEIKPSMREQKAELAVQMAPHLPLVILAKIAEKSRSLREVGGWLTRYEACEYLGEPFDLNEGY